MRERDDLERQNERLLERNEVMQQRQSALVGRIVGELEQLPYQIAVLGHTDDLPIGDELAQRYPSNWELAAARAASVVRLLEAEGVPSDRLLVVSFGPTRPVAPNDTPANRALKRRVDLRLRPVRVSER